MNILKNIYKIFLVCVLWGGGVIVLAAENSSDEAKFEENDKSSNVETIIVLSQRRAENIQAVPISVTAFTGSLLDDKDIHSLEDLDGLVPGLVTTNSVNYGAAPLTIRGIGGANGGGNFFNDEPVAVYVDDVYISRLSFSTADLIDVESIEVLRGPQGTLYGRNSTAGALAVRTARPSEDFEAYIKGGFSQYGEHRLSGAISGSINDDLQARFAFGRSNMDGWGDNLFDDSKVGSSKDTTSRLSLRYAPSETFSGDLILEAQQRDGVPATIALANIAPLTPSTPFVLRSDIDTLLDNNQFSLNDPNRNESETNSATILLNWDLGTVVVDSVSSLRNYDMEGFQDSDGTEYTLFNNNGIMESKQISQEFRFSSNTDDDFSWVAGLYYLQEDVSMNFSIRNFQGLFGSGTDANFVANQEMSTWATFANATYEFSEQLSVTLGARYSAETKTFDNAQVVKTIGQSIPLPIPYGPFPAGARIPANLTFAAPPTFNDEEDFSSFTPRLVMNYQYNEDVMLFASYNQGFKSGGFNSFGLTPAFENEEIDAFEIGIKGDYLNDELRFNAAAFAYDYTNLQVRLPVPTGGVKIQNAGEAEIRGVESELVWSATDNLIISANITFLDTNLTQFFTTEIPEDLLFLIGAPIPLNDIDAKGNELTRAPKVQYYINADYFIEYGNGFEGCFSINYRNRDEIFFLETNQSQDTFSSESSNEINLRLSFGPADESWTIGIYGQNITDERTITQVTALGGHPNAAISEPSKWGIDFTVNFD